jgi:hypothetical protein
MLFCVDPAVMTTFRWADPYETRNGFPNAIACDRKARWQSLSSCGFSGDDGRQDEMFEAGSDRLSAHFLD